MKFKKLYLAFFSSIILSCATQDSHLSISENSNDLFIVDCLLPGQVRKLGQLATYVTARRAIKTSASDCGIRGGEYVAYDRANYLTALNIWMPKAQSGDAEAQNYVGEIYEKGLGIQPDYEMALLWYKKAALQGNNRARMNLGFLYEKGLGVEQNKKKAAEWYEKSSTLSELKIPYATTISTEPDSSQLSSELKILKSALKNSQTEAKNLHSKLAVVHEQLADSKIKLAKTQNDLVGVENQIQDDKKEHQQGQETILLKQLLKDKTLEVQRQQANIQTLETKYKDDIDLLTETLTTTQKRAKQIASELKKENNNAMQSQVALLETEAKLAETEKHLLNIDKLSRQKLGQTEQQTLSYEQEKSRLIAQIATDEELKKKYVTDINRKAIEVESLKNELSSEKKRYELKIEQLKKKVKVEKVADKPKIEIIDPPFVLTRGVPTVTLRSLVKQREIIGKIEASAGIMSLFVNDQKSEINQQGLFKNAVKLSNVETPVNVVAVDNNGSKSSLRFILSLDKVRKVSATTTPVTAKKAEKNWESLNFGHYHALIIANSDYQKVPKLDTPEADARAVEQVLKNQYGFKTRLLLNGTRYQILSELNKLRSKLTEKDNLLIYYAGHGELDQVNMRGHWLPIDADGDNTANWISTVAITDILNAMSVKHVLVVSDSCYSGSMTRSSLARLEAGTTNEQKNDWLKAMLKAKSRTVLTSGGLKPVMDGGGGRHSVFANAFIQALESNSSLLEGQTLYRQVSSNIVAIAAGYGIEQVPEYAPIRHAGHESGEFFFVPR